MTHIRLLVDDYSACYRFYRDSLGFDPTFGDADSGYADFETGDVSLALFSRQEMEDALDEPTASAGGRDAVCVVLRVRDVTETASSLRKEGSSWLPDRRIALRGASGPYMPAIRTERSSSSTNRSIHN